MATIGENIRKYRKAIKISQEELGERAGMHRKTIHFYEKGTRQVQSQYLEPIARVLGVTVDDLIEGTEELGVEDIICMSIQEHVRKVLKDYDIRPKDLEEKK